MNKRLLLIGGGTFSVLLAIFAVLSTSLDHSSFTQDPMPFLGLNQQDTIKLQEGDITNGAIFVPEAAAPAKPFANATRLGSTVDYIYKTIIPSTLPRLETFVSTDRIVYKPTDVVFVEVLVMDSLKKLPYANSQQEISVNIQIVDRNYGEVLESSDITTSTFGPTASFAYKLPEDMETGDYAIIVSGSAFASSQKLITVLDAPYGGDFEMTPEFSTKVSLFNQDLSGSETLFGKIVALKDGKRVNDEGFAMLLYIDLNQLNFIPSNVTVMIQDGQGYFSIDLNDQPVFDFPIFGQMNPMNATNQTATVLFAAMVQLENGDDSFVYYLLKNGTFRLFDMNDINAIFDFGPYVTDPANIDGIFLTETGSDLVENATNKVFFYLFDETPDWWMDLTNISVRAYDINNNGSGVITIAKNVSTQYNGMGSFVYTHKAGLLPFLEFVLPDFQTFQKLPGNPDFPTQLETNGTVDRDNKVIDGPMFFPQNGTVRIPIQIEGFQSRRASFLWKQQLDNDPMLNFVQKLKDFNFTQYDYESDLVFSYDGGYFTVGHEDMPPLIVFNSFPNGENFNNTMGFAYNYQAGLVDGEPAEELMTVTEYNFNIELVAQKFVEITLSELANEFYADLIEIGFDFEDTEGSIDLFSDLFSQVADKPAIGGNYFDKYGPTCDNKQNNGNNTQGGNNQTNQQQERIEAARAEVVYALTKKILASTDPLTITFNTNFYMNESDGYLLAVKQKEKLLYTEVLQFKKGTPLVKTIPATSIVSNGGILSANLYKITNDYLIFASLTGNASFCDMNDLSTMLENMSEEEAIVFAQSVNMTQLDIAMSGNVTDISNNINETVALLKVTLPGKPTCYLLDPTVVESFMTQIGSTQFIRKPAAAKIAITTNKAVYMPGELVSVTVKVTNAAGTVVANPLQYLQLSVTEDVTYPDLNDATIAGMSLFENDLDHSFDVYQQDLTLGDQWFGTPATNISKDANLELFLLTQVYRQNFFELNSLYIIDDVIEAYFNEEELDQNMLDVFQGRDEYAYPTSLDAMSRSFGINFLQLLGDMGSNSGVSPRGSLPYVSGEYLRPIPQYDAQADIPQILTSKGYSHDIPANYDRGAGLDQSETLYFNSGVKINNKTNDFTFQFKASDLLTGFKIKAQTYGSIGMSYSVAKIKVADAFSFNFALPQTMIKGDTVNVTMTISNFNPTPIVFTPSVISPDSNLQVSFNYVVVNGKVVSTLNTYNVSANTTAYKAIFTVTALRPVDRANLKIQLSGASTDGKNNFVETFEQVTSIAPSGARVNQYTAGDVILDGTEGTASPNSLKVTMKLPTLDNFNTTRATISLYKGYAAYLQQPIQDIIEESDNDNNNNTVLSAQDIANRLELAAAFYQTIAPLIGQVDDESFTGMLEEFMYIARGYYRQLGAYQQKNKQDFVGYEYTIGNNQAGNLVLTSYILTVLNKLPFLDDFNNKNGTFQQNLQWVLRRKDNKGNFSVQANETETSGRAPQNVTTAYTLYCLSQLQINGTMPNITVELNTLAAQALKTFTVGAASLTSEPYYLALAIAALANKTQYDATVKILATELVRYQNTSGAFKSIDARANFAYTAFGQIGRDRLIEQTSMAVIALSSINSDVYLSAINKGITFLRAQNRDGDFGGAQSTNTAIQALQAGEEPYTQESCNVTLLINDVAVETNGYYGDHMLYTFNVDQYLTQDLAATNVSVTVQFSDIETESDSNQIKFGYATTLSYIDDTYKGAAPAQNSLNLTVTQAYTANTLGTVAKNNTAFNYNVVITNLDKVRGQNGVVFTFRAPSCVVINPTTLNALIGTGVNQITSYTIDPIDNSAQIYIKSLTNAQVKSFAVSTTQTQVGKCNVRPSTVSYLNSGDEIITAKPAF